MTEWTQLCADLQNVDIRELREIGRQIRFMEGTIGPVESMTKEQLCEAIAAFYMDATQQLAKCDIDSIELEEFNQMDPTSFVINQHGKCWTKHELQTYGAMTNRNRYPVETWSYHFPGKSTTMTYHEARAALGIPPNPPVPVAPLPVPGRARFRTRNGEDGEILIPEGGDQLLN